VALIAIGVGFGGLALAGVANGPAMTIADVPRRAPM
jgi:hypothetical protein